MNKTLSLQTVIMAGGSGTRLWPLSRSGYPKQFLVLAGNTSLLQQAAQRLAGLAAADIVVTSPLVVGNEEHRFMVLDQLREVHATPAAVLLEPMGRNTAPAVTLAALQALEGGADPVLVVTPSDQTVADDAAFTRALQAAARRAASGEIVILGIDRSVERIIVEHGDGGHFGGDPLLHRSLFDPEIEDAMGQRAGARAGAMSVLTGVAAAHSVDLGRPVAIKPLLDE